MDDVAHLLRDGIPDSYAFIESSSQKQSQLCAIRSTDDISAGCRPVGKLSFNTSGRFLFLTSVCGSSFSGPRSAHMSPGASNDSAGTPGSERV